MASESVQTDPETGKAIPMKDGKPCRACVDFKTWTKLEKAKTKKPTATTEENSQKQESVEKPQQTNEDWKRDNCPADVETLDPVQVKKKV
ncbi:hypothetical protein G6F35_017149 [Rhizopus arrhizus]|nr:hypothetical protein G6F23_004486 [Rhizopus arrhizus]KAG1170900.1 hypothetical protein G6F35_017149 [Rhizopus arrhizus]